MTVPLHELVGSAQLLPDSRGSARRKCVVSRPPRKHDLIPSRFASCCCVVCTSLFHSPRVVVDVAVFSTPMAIIAQRAHEWELGRRGFALETAAARVCREAGGRVMTNMLVRDLDLAPGLNTTDGRRLEAIADGLSLFQGAQLAIDTTLVSALRADGTPRPRAATTLGAAADARSRKETTYPELLARVPEPSWSSWLQKSADVGLRRRLSSLVHWRHPKHGQRQRLCKRRWLTLGGTVGEG